MSKVVIALSIPLSDPPVCMIAGSLVEFHPDPDAPGILLAEVTEEQAAFVDGIPGYSVRSGSAGDATPTAEWGKQAILEWGTQNLPGLALDPKAKKDDLLDAINAALAAKAAQ